MQVDTTNVNNALRDLAREASVALVDRLTALIALERRAWSNAVADAALELVDYTEAAAVGLANIARQRRIELDADRRQYRPIAAVADGA